MELVLIPGFWLDGDSWGPVTADLRAAGHHVHPLTLPGMESRDADRSSITLRDHVEAVIAVVDELPDPVVLVGHSGGGAIAWAVADARASGIARVVFVDSGPLGNGNVINDELPVVDGEMPLPEWSVFEAEDLVDLDDALREHFIAIAIPEPAQVASDKQVLSDPRRYEVPATVICCEFSTELMRSWLAGGHPFVAELAAIKDYELVDLPTGHWPQFTKPAALAAVIRAAVER
ncbi:MAG: alpha/beta fold hydrolase [Rhodoglobus sp.]